MKPKHIPVRTCVACRETDQKRELLRVVRLPDGTVEFDAKGKQSGRGAYVCASKGCIQTAQKQKKFERSLKVTACSKELFITLLERSMEARPPIEPTAPADVPLS